MEIHNGLLIEVLFAIFRHSQNIDLYKFPVGDEIIIILILVLIIQRIVFLVKLHQSQIILNILFLDTDVLQFDEIQQVVHFAKK